MSLNAVSKDKTQRIIFATTLLLTAIAIGIVISIARFPLSLVVAGGVMLPMLLLVTIPLFRRIPLELWLTSYFLVLPWTLQLSLLSRERYNLATSPWLFWPV